MSKAFKFAGVFAAVFVVFVSGLGTGLRADYSRRTPIVEAVQKTRSGIVTIKAEKKNGFEQTKDTIGTGFVVDERGYIVTNRHVVASASKVRVFLADGTELAGKVLEEVDETDLAIVRVSAGKKLQALPLGPGSDLMVGETVIAIGHPYGYRNTVSTGIVSALDREITMPSGQTLTNLIQTDSSINPGNSGGPLLNINGEVIGVVVALRDGAQGIAFAINSDTLKEALSQHLSGQAMADVSLGVNTEEKVILPEGPQRQRVVVADVAEQTPAAAAGMAKGDEILRVGERSVSNRFDLERALWDHKAGEEVNFTVLRDGKEMSVGMTLNEGRASASVVAYKAKKAAAASHGEKAVGVDSKSRDR